MLDRQNILALAHQILERGFGPPQETVSNEALTLGRVNVPDISVHLARRLFRIHALPGRVCESSTFCPGFHARHV